MSSIRKRGNTYQIRVSCGYDSKNRQITKTMTFKPAPDMTKKQIEKELKRQAVLFEEKCRTGRFLDGNIKFSDFLERWFRDYADNQLKAKTIARYKAFATRTTEEFGHIRIDKLEPRHFLDFYNKLSQKGVRNDVKFRGIDEFPELMEKKNFTKKSLAEKAKVSEFVISSCMSGKNISNLSAKKILKILPRSVVEISNNDTLSPKTIQHHHRFLSSVLNTAVEWQVIPYNPCDRVKAPKCENKEAACLDDVQVTELINALEKESLRYKTMIMLLLYSGMRRGELCGLEWGDIDFELNLINISKASLYLPGKGIFDDTTKNKSSERVICVPESMITLLAEYKNSQENKTLHCNKVFTNTKGYPIHPDSVTGWFHKFVERNNLPKISIHSLRHTNATLLIAAGTDIKTVANRLGHSTPTITGNIYAHAIKSADAAAAQTLSDILTKSKMDK